MTAPTAPRPPDLVASFASCLWAFLALGCSTPSVVPIDPPAAPRVEISDGWLAMGTFFEVDLRVPADLCEPAHAWLRFARDEIARLESIYSRHDPESELSNLNRILSGGTEDPAAIPLGPDLEDLIDAAERLQLETRGAFDIAVGPLVDLWSAEAKSEDSPSEAARESARARVDAGRKAISQRRLPVSVVAGGRVDLDAVSKGAVLDRLRESFVERFPTGAGLFSFGQSSILALGDPGMGAHPSKDAACGAEGGGWRLALRSRDPSRGELGEIVLCNRALSMSSSLGFVGQREGRRANHVIDPRSGWPVEGVFEAVVIADSATRADAWSTALLIWGEVPDPLATPDTAGLEIWLMNESGRVAQTAGWPGASN